MRPIGRHDSVTIPITPVRTSSDSLRIKSASPLASSLSPQSQDSATTEILLSPAGFVSAKSVESDLQVDSTARQRNLAVAIRQRIESRLGGRVHDLAIRIRDNTIVLEGHCATFHTKQLAQHAALGVIEDELLENAIKVTM